MSSGGSGSSSGAPTPESGHEEGGARANRGRDLGQDRNGECVSRLTVELVRGRPRHDLRRYGVAPQSHGFKSAASAWI